MSQTLSTLNTETPLKKVVVFIPAYNEELTIGKIVDDIRNLYPREETERRGFFIDILVTDDGSTDQTKNIALSKNVTLISLSKNLGLGGAVRSSMKKAFKMGADVAVKLDADSQYSPQDIMKVIEPILRDEADICYGSRFAGKIHYKMPIIRRIGNYFFTFLINTLTDYKISDAQTGLKAFHKDYLSIFEIPGNYNATQQILIDANHKHMHYTEVPIDFYPREKGKSFINLKYPFYVGINLFRILVFSNPFRVFSFVGFVLIVFSILYSVLSFLDLKNNWGSGLLNIERVSLLTLITGINCFFFGILADLIIHRKS